MKPLPHPFARLAAALSLPLLLVPVAAEARPAPKRPVARAAGVCNARPALWKVADADTTIWLFGTIHALPKGLKWSCGKLAGARANYDTLVTEIIEKSPEEMRPVVIAKAMLPQGKTVRDGMSEAERADYEKALATSGMSAGALDAYQPWYAAVALATFPLLASGYDPANGVDAQLAAEATAKGLKREALETPEYQLGLFASLPVAVQKKYLGEVVHNLPKLKGELTAIIAAWKAGNAEKLARLMNDDTDDPALKDTLLVQRNKAWAKWIGKRIAKPGKVFIAVGAGHLAGSGSVQEQLRKAGLTVSRVQ